MKSTYYLYEKVKISKPKKENSEQNKNKKDKSGLDLSVGDWRHHVIGTMAAQGLQKSK